MKDTKPPTRGKRVVAGRENDDTCCRCMTQYITFVVMVFGLTFLHFRKFQYNDKFISVYGGGELSLNHFVGDLNTVLCEEYQLSAWQSLDVYLTSGTARVDTVNRDTVARSGEHLYPSSPVIDNSFYLLEGSVLNLNACRVFERAGQAIEAVDLLIFKGEDSWEKFMSGDCTDCATGNTSLPLDTDCGDFREFLMTYTVQDRDTYHVAIVTKRDGYSTFYIPLIATLIINRTVFDTTDAKKVCSDDKCDIKLPYYQNADIVVRFAENTFITTHCQFRVAFCIGIFVVLPSCLLLLAFICCPVVKMGEKKKPKYHKVTTDLVNVQSEQVDVKDKSSLVENEVPPASDSSTSLV